MHSFWMFTLRRLWLSNVFHRFRLMIWRRIWVKLSSIPMMIYFIRAYTFEKMQQITVLKSCCRDFQLSSFNIICENESLSSSWNDTGPLVLTCKYGLSILKRTKSTKTMPHAKCCIAAYDLIISFDQALCSIKITAAQSFNFLSIHC